MAIAPLLPDFNEAHPPLAVSIEALPPGRTEPATIGEAVIEVADFDYVRDPAYLWQAMPTLTPTEREQRDAVREAKRANVECYRVKRQQFWARVARFQFAENVDYDIATTRGFETKHEDTKRSSRTETIGLTLGLELSGDMFKPGAARRAAAVARSAGDRARSSTQFTYELSNELHFERVDSETYSEEEVRTLRVTFNGGCAYYVWSLVEEMTVLRKRPAIEVPEPLSEIVAATDVSWVDRFQYRAAPTCAPGAEVIAR